MRAGFDERREREERELRAPEELPAPPMTAAHLGILGLQQTVGNAAVARMLQRQEETEAEEEEAPVPEGGSQGPGLSIELGDEPPPPIREAPSAAELGLEADEEEGTEVVEQSVATLARNGSKTKTPKKPAKVTGVLTPQDDFSGHSKTNFGVGERVDLSFKAKPKTSAATLGGLKWEVASGPATVVTALDGTGTLTCGGAPGAVDLELKVDSGADAGTVKDTVKITVIAPDNAVMRRKPGSGLKHNKGKAGVGFLGEAFMRPKNVSFHWAEWREGSVPAVATGSFAHWNGLSHALMPWFPIGPGNSSKGCKISMQDDVFTGDLDPPFAAGDFQWNIGWEYQAAGGAATEFTKALHHGTSDKKGKATIEKKGGGPFSKKASDPTSTH